MPRNQINLPEKIITPPLKKNGFFPNNPTLPLILYKNALSERETGRVEELFRKNHWGNTWVDGIYTFHHYHSNIHEVLGVCSGECTLQAGGPDGPLLKLEKGDVLLIPAGVSHKNLSSSEDFVCVGAYPTNVEYDMNYGKEDELLQAEENIHQVPLPLTDPVYGPQGPLFKYWNG